jgi:hypothetical protein
MQGLCAVTRTHLQRVQPVRALRGPGICCHMHPTRTFTRQHLHPLSPSAASHQLLPPCSCSDLSLLSTVSTPILHTVLSSPTPFTRSLCTKRYSTNTPPPSCHRPDPSNILPPLMLMVPSHQLSSHLSCTTHQPLVNNVSSHQYPSSLLCNLCHLTNILHPSFPLTPQLQHRHAWPDG